MNLNETIVFLSEVCCLWLLVWMVVVMVLIMLKKLFGSVDAVGFYGSFGYVGDGRNCSGWL